MTFHSTLRAVLVASAIATACGSRSPPPSALQTSLGQSTAPGPANSNAPLPDAAGVPQPEQPTPPADPPSSMLWPDGPRATEAVDQEPMDGGLFDDALPDGGAHARTR
jgi:hypothetical protein